MNHIEALLSTAPMIVFLDTPVPGLTYVAYGPYEPLEAMTFCDKWNSANAELLEASNSSWRAIPVLPVPVTV
jgi:hypothetical protein